LFIPYIFSFSPPGGDRYLFPTFHVLFCVGKDFSIGVLDPVLSKAMAEWDTYKSTIEQLYITENKPLKGIVDIMKKGHNFDERHGSD
jgi:hypothetical protein